VELIFKEMKKLIYLIFTVALIVLLSFNISCTSKVKKPPNILFCIADDASLEHFGTYGTSWVNTPNIDNIASKGVKFMNAYTPNAKCAPSRATILTGRNFWQLEEAGNHLNFFPDKFITITEVLHKNGYHVGYTGKGWGPSRTSVVDGKPRDMLIKRYNDKTLTPPASGIANTDYTENFKDFLSEREESQPFFFWYGCREPHRVYEFGSGVKYGNKSVDQIDKVYKFWPDADTVRMDMLDYAFEIEHFDTHLGNMVRMLEEAGELENTLIIVTSDNGMPFPRLKGQVYEYSNHLPLVIMWPDGIRKPGRVVNDFVSFADFAPTFAEVAAVKDEVDQMQPISGKSLTDILFSKKDGRVNPERDHIIVGKERHDLGRPYNQGYPVRGIVKDGFLYLKNFKTDRWPVGNPETGYKNTDNSPTKTFVLNTLRIHNDTTYWSLNFGKRPEEELYDILNDKWCQNNLAEKPEFKSIKKELRKELLNWMEKCGDKGQQTELEAWEHMPGRKKH
jgi:arylsulfatase A-like enzyme